VAAPFRRSTRTILYAIVAVAVAVAGVITWVLATGVG
jgi:hypothetical protein